VGCAQSLIGQGGDRVCANHLLAVDYHRKIWATQVWYQAVVGLPCRNGEMISEQLYGLYGEKTER
jgi:hypothetical protein